MKYLVLIVALVLTSPTWACTIGNTSGLDAATVKQLEQACETAKAAAVEKAKNAVADVSKTDVEKAVKDTSAIVTSENISAFGQASKDVAIAIGIAAKELGMAANDFLTTPAGILTVAVVLWKLFGVQLLGLGLSCLTLYIGIVFCKRAMVKEYVVVEKRRFWGLYTVTKQVPMYLPYDEMSDSQGLSILVGFVATALLLWIFIANLVI